MKFLIISLGVLNLLSFASALASDFIGLGRLVAKNASYALYPSDIRVAGCITDDFLWTINRNKCGIFHGTRAQYWSSVQSYQYVLKSRHGACGLGSQNRVVCGRWGGDNGTDDQRGVFDLPVAPDAPHVMNWGSWLAINNTEFPDGTNELRFREKGSYFLMWWSDGMPTGERDVSIWNNVDDAHPVENVTLNQYDVGARLVWNTLEID